MAITFPRTDIISQAVYADQSFKLVERQEYSRSALGITYAKSLGSGLWVAEYTTKPMRHDAALDFEAMLNSLDGVIGTFHARDLRREYPKAGQFDDSSAAIASLVGDGKSITIDGLPVGATISRGDYVTFIYGVGNTVALHQAMNTVVADGSGITPELELRPHLRVGAAINDVVTLMQPYGVFALDPNSVESRTNGVLHSVVSFKAIQII